LGIFGNDSFGVSNFTVLSVIDYPGQCHSCWPEQVFRNDLFSQKLWLWSWLVINWRELVLLLQSSLMGLNCRRSSELFAEARSSNLIFHCENQPIYTQIHWKVPKIMYVVLRTGYCVIMLSNVAILKRHFA